MNRSAVSGNSQVYNPPPPSSTEVRCGWRRSMTTSVDFLF
jgi:hypothetical protein